jgi:hypothetical protein
MEKEKHEVRGQGRPHELEPEMRRSKPGAHMARAHTQLFFLLQQSWSQGCLLASFFLLLVRWLSTVIAH